jgi:lambda repressor-like predicted transcriptional regulator
VRRGVTIRQIHRAAQAKGLPYGYDELARAVRGSYRYDLRQFIAEQLGKSVEQLWPER